MMRPIKRKKIMSDINITPLTDVCLVLLIIFMVTASFLTTQAGLDVKLPQVATGAPQPSRDIVVTVTKAGKIFLDGRPTNMEALYQNLVSRAKEAPNRLVIVEADRSVVYDKVVSIIDTAKLAGLTRIALATEPKEGAPPMIIRR